AVTRFVAMADFSRCWNHLAETDSAPLDIAPRIGQKREPDGSARHDPQTPLPPLLLLLPEGADRALREGRGIRTGGGRSRRSGLARRVRGGVAARQVSGSRR